MEHCCLSYCTERLAVMLSITVRHQRISGTAILGTRIAAYYALGIRQTESPAACCLYTSCTRATYFTCAIGAMASCLPVLAAATAPPPLVMAVTLAHTAKRTSGTSSSRY